MLTVDGSMLEELVALITEAHETEDLVTQAQKVQAAHQLLVEHGYA